MAHTKSIEVGETVIIREKDGETVTYREATVTKLFKRGLFFLADGVKFSGIYGTNGARGYDLVAARNGAGQFDYQEFKANL